jgi:hypothetical protein
MNKLLMGLLVLFLLSMPVACAQPTQVPEAEPKPTPDAQTPATAPAPGPPGAANDDVVYPPGGFTYGPASGILPRR